MASSLINRQTGLDLVGSTYDTAAGVVLSTVQGDGITAHDLDQKHLWSLPLGSRATLEFQTPSVQSLPDPADNSRPQRCTVASVVHDRASKQYTLCVQDPSSSARSIPDAPSRIVLPGPAHSCHLLRRTIHHGAPTSSHTGAPQLLAPAVVLADGRIGFTDLAAEPSSANRLSLLPSDRAAPPRYILAASSQDTLVVATQQSAGAALSIRVLRLSGGADGPVLTPVKSLAVPCPGAVAAHAVPTGLTLSPTAFALVQWSHGYATAVHGVAGGAGSPLRPSHFPLADAVTANGASSSSAPSAAAGATPGAAVTASGRKRKSAAAAAVASGAGGAADGAGGGGSARPRALCAAVDDGQFVVLDLESNAAQSQVCYSLHDAQFGCPLASGAVDVDAPLLSLDLSQCSVVGAGPEATVVRLGAAVHVLRLQAQPVSLLSLVARLAVNAASATAAAAAAGADGRHKQQQQQQQRQAGIGGRVVAGPMSSMPVPVTLDRGLLANSPAAAAPAAGGSEGVAAAAAAMAAAAADDLIDMELRPVPAASFNRVEDICKSLVDQLLAAPSPPAAPPPALLDSAVSYISGRRLHGMPVPSQLLSLTARGLAAAKQWPQLGTLLGQAEPGSLVGCGDVLLGAVAAQQYPLLSRLCVVMDEVDSKVLVAVLQLLLAPTTRSNLAARQRHYEGVRKAAEAAVEETERTAAAATGGPRQVAQPTAIALAQCAAAAVDGFSYREVLLHPLLALPVDAPAVQVALRELTGPAADTLLGYLAKWAAKYADGTLGEMAATGVVVPPELQFPHYHQVLEWTRMTIDAHLTRLLMARTPLPALETLQTALARAVKGGKVLMMLRGALEHVSAAAPLPAAHIAVATQYTAEVLDLRVR